MASRAAFILKTDFNCHLRTMNFALNDETCTVAVSTLETVLEPMKKVIGDDHATVLQELDALDHICEEATVADQDKSCAKSRHALVCAVHNVFESMQEATEDVVAVNQADWREILSEGAEVLHGLAPLYSENVPEGHEFMEQPKISAALDEVADKIEHLAQTTPLPASKNLKRYRVA